MTTIKDYRVAFNAVQDVAGRDVACDVLNNILYLKQVGGELSAKEASWVWAEVTEMVEGLRQVEEN